MKRDTEHDVRRGSAESWKYLQDQTRPAVSDRYFRFDSTRFPGAQEMHGRSGSAPTALHGANSLLWCSAVERSSAWEFFFFSALVTDGILFLTAATRGIGKQ